MYPERAEQRDTHRGDREHADARDGCRLVSAVVGAYDSDEYRTDTYADAAPAYAPRGQVMTSARM